MSESQFKKAADIIQNLPKDGKIKPTTDDQLYFYKYFKQATIGDVNTTRPGLFDFVGKAKWEAWKGVEGTPKEDSWKLYVEKFIEVLKSVDDEESKKHITEIESA
ncbi:ACBP-domain-containing protein [Coprinopsis marcescibilis]|uniref:ACBP-domain-containing protein n=1 Tax=Coprinopsis marcescibilis TaxID=230819 RepID=A0A5C3L524_COPMA|nr:ACBP-domain-containing protein [Coprinopsis marcescibilis]